MAYEIKKLENDEALSIRKLVELVEFKTSAKVVFLDVVSVEKKISKYYSVKWFAKDECTLKKYHTLISDYFKDDTRKSLLFLSANPPKESSINGRESRIIHFNSISNGKDCECKINTEQYLEALFSNDEFNYIDKSCESKHIEKWKNEILSKMCVSSAVFTKIDFSISKRNFGAAIWIGFNKETAEELFTTEFILNPYIENYLWSYSSQSIASELISDIEQQATRAAISQVMARNTSHNIGAHVMNKLIGDLSALTLFDFFNTKEHNYESTFEKDIKKLHKDVENKINDPDLESLPEAHKKKVLKHRILLEQISIFNNYVKCRMDYLADISFGTPLMQTNKYAFGELFKDLDKVRLLLEFISGLSDFKYEIRFTKNGEPLTTDNDLLVAIPNDILGTQAFYNILENIIRNTAKHSSTKPDITTFTVNFIDDVEKAEYCKCEVPCKCSKPTKTELQYVLNEFIAVEIYDNIPIEETDEHLNLTEDDIKEFREKNTLIPNDSRFRSYAEKLVFKQNEKLNDDILKDNKLRSSSLGLVEMDASAAYLRKRPVEFINHPSYDIQYDESWSRNSELNKDKEHELRGINCRHFLKAFKKENVSAYFDSEEKKGNALGYRFFLHRPAVVLVVTDMECEKKDDLKKEGIWVVPPKPKEEEIKSGKKDESFETHLKEGKVYPHEFVIYTNDAVESLIDVYKTSLPIRILKVEGSKVKELFVKAGDLLNEWEKICWEMWDNTFLQLQYNIDTPLPKKGKLHSDFNNHADDYPNENEQKFYFYFDALSSLGQRKLPKYNGKLSEGEGGFAINYKNIILNTDVISKLKVGESIYSRILVIDERIQENSKKEYMQGVLFSSIYKMTGIIIPQEDINLSATSMDDVLTGKIKAEIENYLVTDSISNIAMNDSSKKLNPNYDFVLIHYSILERMFNSNKDEIEKYLKGLGNKNNVVITSGRGEPDRLPREVRFINLSSVIHALVETHSKYFTNYILHQSKRSSKLKI